MNTDSDTIIYKKVRKEDMDELIGYYEEYLNSGDMVGKSIRTAFSDRGYHGYRAEAGGRTVGYFTFQKGICLTYPHPELMTELREYAADDKIETVDALVVVPGYRRRGIAGAMADLNKEMLTGEGVHRFFVEIWVYPDGKSSAKKVYERMGKVVYSRYVEGFYKDSRKYGLKCPICGIDCKCSAILEIIEM